MTQFDFIDIGDLADKWVIALAIAVSMRVIARSEGRRASRPILTGALDFLFFGSVLAVFDIANKAYIHGTISLWLCILAYLAALLAGGCFRVAALLWWPRA
jgi:hypothetical protein